jgi:low temperature requirement protein LtrA
VTAERHPRLLPVQEEARVTPIELFFDLVFVFSLTQVTSLMAADPTWHGVARGLLVLALLWWAWVGYAWLGNVVQAEEGLGRPTMLAAMAAIFLVAITVPEAFEDHRGGLPGPVVIAVAYLSVRVLHVVMFWLAARQSEDRELGRQVARFAPSGLASSGVLLVASQLDGVTQTLAWVVALLLDYVGTILAGASGWRLRSASHFAERHGLIVIVALGESIVAIGVGISDVPVSWAIVGASVLGLAVAAGLWWAYFDVVSIAVERMLRRSEGEARTRLARDGYSYLHLPIVAGVVLMALGIEQVLEHVGAPTTHPLSDPLETVPLATLYGGVALFLLAHSAFKWRALRLVGGRRIAAAAALLAAIPLLSDAPALVSLAVLAVAMSVLVGSEAVRYAEERERVRHEDGDLTHDARPRSVRARRS